MKRALLVLLFLAGCATATMDGIMRSWQGGNIDQVISRWGPPNLERPYRGNKLYVWNDSTEFVMPQSATNVSTVQTASPNTSTVTTAAIVAGGETVAGACERIFEVNPAGTIVSWNWSGNNCCAVALAGRCAAMGNPVPIK